MSQEHFPKIKKIAFEGPQSKNPLAFRHYNADEVVGKKKMKDHLRFGVAYWHAMKNSLADPFGAGTAIRPWDDRSNSVENACRVADACFEFTGKLGIEYYCFHDRDVSPELGSLKENNAALQSVADHLSTLQKKTGIKLLGHRLPFLPPPLQSGGWHQP